jgi:hypothetical protein
MAAKDRQDVETAAQRETLQVTSLSSSVVDLGHFGTDPVRIHGSVQLAYGPPFYFRHTVKTKYIFLFFCLLPNFFDVHLHHSSKIKGHKQVTKQ